MDNSEEFADVVVEIETQYKCRVCRRDYKSQKALKLHIRLKHSELRIFVCEVCEK